MKKIVIRSDGTVLKTNNAEIAQVVLIKLSNEEHDNKILKSNPPIALTNSWVTETTKIKTKKIDPELTPEQLIEKRKKQKLSRDKYQAKKKLNYEAMEKGEIPTEQIKKSAAFVNWTSEEDDIILDNLNLKPIDMVTLDSLQRHSKSAIVTRFSAIRNMDKERLSEDLYAKVKSVIEDKYTRKELKENQTPEEVKQEQTNDLLGQDKTE